MPAEVFEMWLDPFIKEIGWPFTDTIQDISGTRWQYLLANISLKAWKEAEWESINCKETELSFESKLKIEDIILHCTTSHQTTMANLHRTKERFRTCAEFAANNLTIPLPVVAIRRHGWIEIVDGHHRLAGLFHLRGHGEYEFPVYVATFEHI